MWKLKKQQNLPREFHYIAHALYYLYRKFSTGAGVCDVNQSTVKEAEWLWSFLDYCYVMEKRNCSKTIEGKVKLKAERSTVPAIICPVYEGVLIKLQMYHKKLNVALIFSILITNLYFMAEKKTLYPLVDQMANL